MSGDVNFVILPGGERLVRDDDEGAAKPRRSGSDFSRPCT